ncbi:hypothetical protein K9U39_05400 [Rhodoblastus acidophilus]|uniref:Uncharacterized protein n=1 Tax=Candidatus Rhodoblastus alkanivorans TaxID=2954117 RepID=A0ABS9Z8W6_9HYPH|nr:hypothetical protein [Candidatus Rhodoblastus alkanivorans]MCI4678668.1 hypothetical protein [Candidatus Rhodoblastus alkanivorans]MCI4683077.1 hypothetical protein [Candidatus Rhodoblastus alkanivorans]MDI4640388.1 hypothetical protein [Rhodoblastus acidophilus]
MRRLSNILLATCLICGGFAGAQAAPMKKASHWRHQYDGHYETLYDGRYWPASPSPARSVGFAATSVVGIVGGVLTNPCYLGGCLADPRDACRPGSSCSGSWGGVTAADERSTTAAYQALSRKASEMAAKGQVSPVTIDTGSK